LREAGQWNLQGPALIFLGEVFRESAVADTAIEELLRSLKVVSAN
jgi:hypothetical protein